jgi:hypothetical protein
MSFNLSLSKEEILSTNKLSWYCEPKEWQVNNGLVIQSEPKTDYWSKTHYGFIADNGHLLYKPVEGNFIMTTKIAVNPAHQYDQAGLMVRISPNCWVKTSVEYETPHEPSRLGAVVTNNGYSDWSTQNVPNTTREYELRVKRTGADYFVEARLSGHEWEQIRICRLHEDDGKQAVQAGVYVCSPNEGTGFSATVLEFSITAL